MLVYSKQSSPAFRTPSHPQHHHRPNQRISAGDNHSDLEVLVREPNSRTFLNRKQKPDNMKKYLPRLESNERLRSHDIKRSCSVNLRCIPPSTTVRLPGISSTRKSSISDSTNTTSSSTSSIPSIEITEPEADEELELIMPFQRDTLLNNGKNPLQVSKNFETGRRIISGPRPPRSPRPIDRTFVTNKRSSGNSRRHFKRSQHFELTLQNIEEVKDMEIDSSSLGKLDTSSLLGERVGADQQETRLVSGHHRSHSTPVDYRELRSKIEATRLVNMGDLSVEFTKHYLSKKELKEEESDEDIRNRCINWLKSLNSS